ncbi:BREX-1 system adenine-specific DNA-methyltransferase PglX [Planococcus sp. CP5-4]|uniref:BREX-1 system adenine-specific DNA-methyltransferase PglX n=1 Tax=unclassified Planococcus (in: firmicutes) TaxID=2662419 RepID=UPI001C221F87|nr:BREX-1 system adenine-specific DNA-methyltransferase PglX [Planococcus sp. CP5-4]MBU9673996.1 BREX-1 system adenine-specific DNA-methyltransferase PglX [Planococcus sp. CP5-4_YE]MBV0909867.1 BREX-1 system adenine-specific DNA-methyltransferase PglX [Planococcus sp. CP5-4_UN]MBW6064747.1 BREX-1 system adenine-specific DNA-methyltransferase PglX [Planococcus sp. CP5-4]
MNKPALKRFATEARRELLERVELQARKIGITSEDIQKATIESSDAIFINGRQLKEKEKVQRNKLISRIRDIGFDRVMEEVAYTWFNRFTALRFMEVNDYLPTKVRVLSSSKQGSTEPDMMNEALSLDLDLDKEYVYELKLNNNDEELFKYLVIKHCNDLNRYMPFMFETIDHYTEILFPEGLLGTDSFVREMTDLETLPEENWQKVEVIGWLYQYYISEENERVIQAKKRYKAEELPFATQLFTPEWIVRYMVQNALGRYWIESHPEDYDLVKNWEFYLENQNVDSTFEENLAPYINKELKVEEITCLDPAMGSGHILVYMFDVLYEIYSKAGYMDREIPRLIIENNLYGLDIDDRAYQLASFSIVMKALEYNKRFLRSIERDGLKMNLAALQETNTLKDEEIAFLAGEVSSESYENMKGFIEQFHHAKAIGSLIKLNSFDEAWLKQRMKAIGEQTGNLFEMDMKDRVAPLFNSLVKQAGIMNQQYDIFITNPPYAGNKYVPAEVSSYLVNSYQEVKSDLFSAFIEYSFSATKENGQIGFMSPFVWMFISSFEKLRKNIVNNRTISSLIQLEYSGFDGATVPICTFTLRNYPSNTKGEYIRLSDFRGVKNQSIKTLKAVTNPSVIYRYSFNQNDFKIIPGSPVAYWVSDKQKKVFENSTTLNKLAEVKQGLSTADNNRFLRLWHEVNYKKIGLNFRDSESAIKSRLKWFPFNKGGDFRKWYGNNDYVINWENNGYQLKKFKNAAIRNSDYYFKASVTWSKISSGNMAFRYKPEGFIFADAGTSFFSKSHLNYLHGFCNSIVALKIANTISPTLNYEVGHISSFPIKVSETKKEEIDSLVDSNISISKTDWNYFETSWEFKKHPLICFSKKSLKLAFDDWEKFTDTQFKQIHSNEENLNRIFIEIYNLTDEISYEVNKKDITIRRANLETDIKSFISYAIGCSFGRYSLDEEGIIYAGGDLNSSQYRKYYIDEDNILPLLTIAYFNDDIVSRFVEFVRINYSEDTLEENLGFIAEAIGRKKSETVRESLRRYLLNDFYKEHVQIYKKRPIYWLFSSGKEKAFNCLIYMHRYDKTTLSRIRTDYLHEVQIRMDAEKKELLTIIDGDSTTKEISNAKKELKSLDKKIDELKAYDEKLHHMADMQIEIDLDDGVAVNYAKFEGLVAKI